MAGNPDLSETHTESQVYLSTRGGDYGVRPRKSTGPANWPFRAVY